MSSNRRITANRENSKRSTGPRSNAGKQRASNNSLKHGLTSTRPAVLAGESETEFEELRVGFHDDLQPVGADQVFLVERLVRAAWSMRRADKLEAELFDLQILADETKGLEAQLEPEYRMPPQIAAKLSPSLRPGEEDGLRRRLEERKGSMAGFRLGHSFLSLTSGDDSLGKLQRYQAAHERSFYRALHELERMQRRSAGEDVPAPRVAELDVNIRSAEVPVPVAPPSVGPTAAETNPEADAETKTADALESPQSPDPVEPPVQAQLIAGDRLTPHIPVDETNPTPAGPEAARPGAGAQTVDPSSRQRDVALEVSNGARLPEPRYETKPPVLDQRVERMERLLFKR